MTERPITVTELKYITPPITDKAQ